jgi:putative transposase
MGKFNPDIHHRRSIRLKDYDYSQAGAYFITICTQNRECLFGEIINGKMILNGYGEMVLKCWSDLPNHYYNLILDSFVLMPNHLHGIMYIPVNVGAGLKPAPTRASKKTHGLPEFVRALKTFSARRINEIRNTPGISVWQRNYYERVIRDESELNKIREYIINNPLNWETDENYKN